jgi:uncharacterized protein
MKIAVIGATGFVGSRLVEKLHESCEGILILARNTQKAEKYFPKSVFKNVEIVGFNADNIESWSEKISGCHGVINLAGEPIAERWTDSYKEAIMNSRKNTTTNIVKAIANSSSKPSVLINASAVGYYGASETAIFDENSSPSDDFLGKVCQNWENAAQKVTETGTRLVILRLGIVLGKEGGAIAKMLTPFQLFVGGPIGTGKQWVSWINREDLVNLIIYSLKNAQVSGVLNATAPNPVTMSELAQTLGKVLNRPAIFPVPEFVLKLLLGEGAQVVLEGQKVLPKRTLETGFKFDYPEIKSALEQFLK